MRLLWYQDYNPMSHPGGSQANDREKIIAGLRRGHDIYISTPDDPKDPIGVDMLVFSNATAYQRRLWEHTIAEEIPFVFFLHDYWPLCRVRLHYPMLEKCRDCFRKPDWVPVLQKARLIVWLSPLHRDAWLFSCPELAETPHLLNPSTVASEQFCDLGLERKGAIAVNSGMAFKGRDMVLAWANEHPDTPLTLIGPAGGVRWPEHVAIVDMLPYEAMNEAYNRHELFVHLPMTPMPFDRTPVEALLAGCRVLCNENVGAMSWPEIRGGSRSEVVSLMQDANAQFWDAVEGAV